MEKQIVIALLDMYALLLLNSGWMTEQDYMEIGLPSVVSSVYDYNDCAVFKNNKFKIDLIVDFEKKGKLYRATSYSLYSNGEKLLGT